MTPIRGCGTYVSCEYDKAGIFVAGAETATVGSTAGEPAVTKPTVTEAADGTRSIRFGNHEMNSMETMKFHFHQEEWIYDAVNDIMEYSNTFVRVRK